MVNNRVQSRQNAVAKMEWVDLSMDSIFMKG
jgi:hypothetical protein